MEIPSGPSALEVLLCFMALLVSSGVYGTALFKPLFFRSFVILREIFELVCLTTEENWLLKLSAILSGFRMYLPLNLIALLFLL